MLRTVDLNFKRRDYRLSETIREQSSVRPMEIQFAWCDACGRQIRQASRYVKIPSFYYHPQCAINLNLLLETPESIADRMLAERDAAYDRYLATLAAEARADAELEARR